MTDRPITTRLRALGIEPGEAACDYELRAQESNLIPRLSADAALDEALTALEFEREAHVHDEHRAAHHYAEWRQAEAERDAAIAQAQGWSYEAKAQRATVHESYQAVTGSTGEPGDWHGAEPIRQRIAELDAELEIWKCVIARLPNQDAIRDLYERYKGDGDRGGFTTSGTVSRTDTAFGILSDLHPEDAAEAWRKAGELGGGGA